jgi:hypothetical protein
MTDETALIVQLQRDGAVDRSLRADPPPSVLSGRVVLDHVAPEEPGYLGPPQAGEVVMSVLSPEALSRDPRELSDVISQAPDADEPLVIVVEAAEELREDELAVVVDAAARAHRPVILRVMSDS